MRIPNTFKAGCNWGFLYGGPIAMTLAITAWRWKGHWAVLGMAGLWIAVFWFKVWRGRITPFREADDAKS
jgi:hypothetical protein